MMPLPMTKNGTMNYLSKLLHFVGLYSAIEEYVKVGHNFHMKATILKNMLTTEHCSTLDSDSKMIIEQYEKDQRCFVFGDIKKVLIAGICGNPNERKYLEYVPPEERMKKTTFMSSYFSCVVDRVTKTRIEASIKLQLQKIK